MLNLVVRRLDAFDRIGDFGDEYPLTPVIPAVTTLFTGIETIATAIRGHAGDQDGGFGEFRGGTANRRIVADQLLAQMRPINEIARALDREEHPGVREQFFMPRSGGYEGVIARAQAFVDAIVPIKALFVDRGLAETFDVDLAAKLAELVAATNRKNLGRALRAGGTAGLNAKSRDGMRLVRELDAILRHQYRNNPVLLAAWKSASRVERAAATAPTTPAGPPAP